jgi:hypothetical protein
MTGASLCRLPKLIHSHETSKSAWIQGVPSGCPIWVLLMQEVLHWAPCYSMRTWALSSCYCGDHWNPESHSKWLSWHTWDTTPGRQTQSCIFPSPGFTITSWPCWRPQLAWLVPCLLLFVLHSALNAVTTRKSLNGVWVRTLVSTLVSALREMRKLFESFCTVSGFILCSCYMLATDGSQENLQWRKEWWASIWSNNLSQGPEDHCDLMPNLFLFSMREMEAKLVVWLPVVADLSGVKLQENLHPLDRWQLWV